MRITIKKSDWEWMEQIILSEQIAHEHAAEVLRDNPEFAEFYTQRMKAGRGTGKDEQDIHIRKL